MFMSIFEVVPNAVSMEHFDTWMSVLGNLWIHDLGECPPTIFEVAVGDGCYPLSTGEGS